MGVTMKQILVLLSFILSSIIYSQTNLDNYIQQGLDNNLTLKQKEFSLKKSLAALDEARGLFLPSIGINARYTKAGGGRTIELPIGDLMNPVYSTLNQMLGQSKFPQIENEEILFLRETEHETKLSLVQPIFQPEIYYNYKIKSDLSEVQKAERDVFARALIADIKTAYYNYLITVNMLDLVNTTEEILKENLRVSKSLVENDKATIDVVYRAEAELSQLQQQKQEAEKGNIVAKAYLNFLLNKDQEAEVLVDKVDLNPPAPAFTMEEAINYALKNREELKQIDFALNASNENISLNKSRFLPNLVLAADYGFQGEKYKFTTNDDFWNASLVMQWNLFRGFQDKAKIEQAVWDKKSLDAQQLELDNHIRLQVRETYQNLIVAQKSISAARSRVTSANKSFEIIDRKYREGMASQIEFIDARTTKTNAELNDIVTTFEYLISFAKLERVTAYYPTIK